MTGKVAEIQHLASPDSLAASIAQMYDQWRVARSMKVDEWKELRNFLFATDTTKTTNASLPWKNKTTLPKLTQIRDNLHANYRAALFSNSEWLKWEGYSLVDNSKEKRKAIESYMYNKLRESGFESTITKMLYDYIDYGNVFGRVEFVQEYKVDPETGDKIPGYIGPRLVRISPYDIVFNPTATSFEDSPKITRYVKSLGELKDELGSRPELDYMEEAIRKAEVYRNAIGSFKDSDLDKAEGYQIDGFGTMMEYYQSGYVEILEFEGNLHDITTGEFLRDHIITILDRKWVVRKKSNPSWLGKAPYAHVGWRERSDNLYAMGPLDNLVGLQYRIDHLENLKADALDQTIHPPKLIKGDVSPFVWGPDAEIIINDADGSVELLTPNVAAFQVNNEIGMLMSVMEEMAGAPKEAMGIRSPGEKTAFEVQQLQNASGRIFQDKVSKFERDFMEPLLNIMLEVARRNMDGADLVRVMDDDLGVVSFLSITKEDITAKGIMHPVGARHFAQQALFMQNMNGVFASPIAAMIAPHISSKQVAKMVEDLFGWERYQLVQDNIAIFEQAETQRLVNQMQEQLEVEQATPLAPTDEELT